MPDVSVRDSKIYCVLFKVIDKLGNIRTIPSSNIKFEYRKNDLPEDLIFLVHRLKKAQKSDSLKIQSEMNRLKK